MIDKFQRHPTEADCVILHVSGIMAAFGTDGKIEIRNQAYRDALEAAGKMED
jgi:hypothetical protein